MVSDEPRNSSQRLKTAMWSVLWSAVLTTFIAFTIRANNECLLVVNGAGWIWTIVILIWLWILAFLSFRSLGKSILVVGTFLLFAFYGNVDRIPIAAAEGAAVGHLKRLSEAAREYRSQHPTEGFPDSLPIVAKGHDSDRTEQIYRIIYKASRSNAGGPLDKLLIQAIPLRRDCGYKRSFAVTENGNLYSTIEARPANDSDTLLQ